MAENEASPVNVLCGGALIEQVGSFRYLGTTLYNKGDEDDLTEVH